LGQAGTSGRDHEGHHAAKYPKTNEHHGYWITSSARASTDGGIVKPRALAVLIDHELKLRALLDGKVGGLRALERLCRPSP
jgi:hypothetical protein